ncbi:MAG TPA: hypothetical protein VGH99_15700 [Pseudonocardia sp.]
MRTTLDHPLAAIFNRAALGSYPKPDGTIESVGPLDGPCDSITVFSSHVVIAADVSDQWVRDHTPARWDADRADLGNVLVQLVLDMSHQLGQPAAAPSTLCAASHQAAIVHGDLTRGGEAQPAWAAYRTDIESHRYRSVGGNGTIALGRGPAGRQDLYIEVDQDSTNSTSRTSRELLRTAKSLVPTGTGLFGSAQLHDTRVLRSVIAAGFEPVAMEVLFLTRR